MKLTKFGVDYAWFQRARKYQACARARIRPARPAPETRPIRPGLRRGIILGTLPIGKYEPYVMLVEWPNIFQAPLNIRRRPDQVRPVTR